MCLARLTADVGTAHDQVIAVAKLIGDARALRLRAARVHLEHGHAGEGKGLGVELREPRRHKEDDELVRRIADEGAQQKKELGRLAG